MTPKRAMTIALVLAAAMPAAAGAQTPITPPDGDSYLKPVFVNDAQHPLPSTEVGITADTTTYTLQDDMYNPPSSGGPSEPRDCGGPGSPNPYGNTIWSVVYADRYGTLDISTAGNFDSVIGVVPFNNPFNDPAPHLNDGFCVDRLAGFQEETSFLVSPRHWYAIQVGGSGPSSGQIQVKYFLKKPPSVSGQAFLFWNSKPLKITKMFVKSVPRGQRIKVSCTKHACPTKTIKVKSKPAAPGKVQQIVREAKGQVSIFKNQKVKKGAKIELRITRPGYIGKYYVWTVAASSISSATTRCMNPGSTKPRKKCHG
jgi:hypothetical protein